MIVRQNRVRFRSIAPSSTALSLRSNEPAFREEVQALARDRVREKLAPREGIEPPTPCLEGRCSIRLSYRGARNFLAMTPAYQTLVSLSNPRESVGSVEGVFLPIDHFLAYLGEGASLSTERK